MTLTFYPEQSRALRERLLFFPCAAFRCPSKPSLADLPEAAWVHLFNQLVRGAAVSSVERVEVGYTLAGDRENCFPGGAFVRVMERVKFNFVAISLGHCMMNLDSNARGYREGKCQHISNPV